MKYNASQIGPLLSSAGRFVNGPDFLKALLAIVAMSIPVVLGVYLHLLDYFISIAVGVLVCFGSDVAGSRRRKTATVLIASGLAISVYVAIFLVTPHLYLLIPVLCALVFAVSFLAVYGFAASLVSFSGLLAIVLSFSQHNSEVSIWGIAGLMACGSLWYLLLSHLFYPLLHRRQIEHHIAHTMDLTATYIKLRARLAAGEAGVEKLETELGETHVSINESHETLRQLLLTRRKTSGYSHFKRKQLLLFIDMIDVLELALANPYNYRRILEQDPAQKAKIRPFVDLMFVISERLSALATAISEDENLKISKERTTELLKLCKQTISELRITSASSREMALFLNNLLDYLKRQLQKTEAMELVYSNIDVQERRSRTIRSGDNRKFLTNQDYHLSILKEHFQPDSPIFRHSARITVAMLVGFLAGLIFSLQNAYWILLTIVVIMRPGYTLTKKRGKQRLFGTLIGAAIAVPVVLLTQNVYLYAVLSMVCMLLAYSMVQKNYRTASIFITLSIVFVYALIEPSAFFAIQFRVVDTIAGAAIATLANNFLWPSWEYYDINVPIINAIKANRKYLEKTNLTLTAESDELTPYRLARKEVFLAVGNLTAAFQRMSQEPSHTHRHLNVVYELTGLNQTFLSATAALAHFMQRKISCNIQSELDALIRQIDSKLEHTQNLLEQNIGAHSLTHIPLQNTDEIFEALKKKLASEQTGVNNSDQQADLVIGQLKWLLNLAESMQKTAAKLRQIEIPGATAEEDFQEVLASKPATPAQ